MTMLLNLGAVLSLLLSTFGVVKAELFADDQLLVTIKSEPEGDLIHRLIMTTDDENSITMITRTSAVSTDEFSIQQILEETLVLARSEGMNAVLLTCFDCDPAEGGLVSLSYLYNGISQTYRNLNLDLSVDSDGFWSLYTADGELVESLTLKPKKLFGQLIGIDRIEVNTF